MRAIFNEEDAMTQLKAKSFRCEDGVWKQFKLICTLNGDVMQDKLGELVEEYVDSQKTMLPKSVFPRTKRKRV